MTYTRSGATGIVIGRLADGSRFLATTAPADERTVAALLAEDVFGTEVTVTTDGTHNTVALR